MAKADLKKTLNCDSKKLFEAVTRYEDYPQFVDGLTGVKVDRKAKDKVKVTYELSMMGQNISYTLEHREDAVKGKVEWSLMNSEFFKVNNGHWSIKPSGKGKTDIEYAIEVEFKISIPGFILKRLISGSLPKMVEGFESRAKG